MSEQPAGTATRTTSPAAASSSGSAADAAPILVVEDDRAVRNLITTALDVHGYRYRSAATARDALLSATSHAPALVLLDLGLPDMDGVQVIEKLRGWSMVPIIVISARGEEADKIGALDAGADDYLTKPFSVDELLARVRAELRRSTAVASGATEQPVFTDGDLSIDFAAGCAYLGGEPLHLTPIEYKLLVLMAKNVGKVLTHATITREIWGTSWESDIASLRVFMRTLRMKIEPDPSHPIYIQTHVGVGYRLCRVD